MVTFESDEAVQKLGAISTSESLSSLLSLLCGEEIDAERLTSEANDGIAEILKRARDNGPDNLQMSYEEFNELLLIFNQYRVERPFFDFFFLQNDQRNGESKPSISFRDLPSGVSRFRGFALLCYGNFRFAYRELSEITNADKFKRKLKPWNWEEDEEKDKLKKRKEPLLRLTNTSITFS